MISNDRATAFQSEYLQTKTMLDRIGELGINTASLRKVLEQIKEGCQKEVESINSGYGMSEQGQSLGGFSFASNMLEYNKGIDQLKEFQSSLIECFGDYAKISDSLEVMDNYLQQTSFTKEEVSRYAEEVIENLRRLNQSSTIDFESEREITEKLYTLAYKIIKLELLYFDTSKVLTSIKMNPDTIGFINKCVKDDLDRFKLDKPYFKDVLLRKDEIEKDGLHADYADEQLILLIASKDGFRDQTTTKNEMLELRDQIISKEQDIENNNFSKRRLDSYLDDYKMDVLRSRREIPKRIAKTLSTFVLVAGVGFGTFHVANFFRTSTEYKTTTETYNPTTGSAFSDSYEKEMKSDQEIQIIGYEPWEKTNSFFEEEGFKRETSTYDASDIDYAELKSYLELNLEQLGIKASESIQKKEHLVPEDLYTNPTVEVVRKTQNLEDSQIVQHEVRRNVILLVSATILAAIGITSLAYLVKGFQELRRNVKKQQEAQEKLDEIIAEGERLFKENEEFKVKFLEYYDRYGYEFTQDNEFKDFTEGLEQGRSR